MADTLSQLVDGLPADNITVKVLNALDFLSPGEWQNYTSMTDLIQAVTGERNPRMIDRIRDRADDLYLDRKQPYQRVIGLYKTIDKADMTMATAALANKVGEKISFLGFLNNVTPKPDTVQSLDLLLKVVVELIAYCQLSGLQPNPVQFAQSLSANYQDAAWMRMVALVCIDALLPLGTDFLAKIHGVMQGTEEAGMTQNPVFLAVNQYLPGDNPQDKIGFVNQSFAAVEGWMNGFVTKTGLTPENIVNSLGKFIQMADGKLDVIAAILDQTTNYYEHTGIQTVARTAILAAYEQVQAEPEPVDKTASPTPARRAAAATDASTYSVGQTVDVWDEDEEEWYTAQILNIDGEGDDREYEVHYEGYSSDDDEWVTEDDLRPQITGDLDDNGFAVGQTVKVWDEEEEEWHSAVIRKYQDEEDEYFIHYIGYGSGSDEWVEADDMA